RRGPHDRRGPRAHRRQQEPRRRAAGIEPHDAGREAAPQARRAADVAAYSSFGSASAILFTPSSTFFIEVAYDRRTKPGAGRADRGTTATLAASISHSQSWASFSIFFPSGVFLPTKADRSGKA